MIGRDHHAGWQVNSGTAASVEWRRIVDSRDVDETRAYLRARFGDDLAFEPARWREQQVDVRIEGVDLPSTLIHHVRCSGAAIEGSRPDSHYVVFIPVNGTIEASANRSSLVCTPRRAVVFCPLSARRILRHEAPATALALRLSHSAVARQLGALLGEPTDALPEFAPAMELARGYGQDFARYLLLAVRDFKQADPTPWTPITISAFEDFLVSKLLLTHPHSYTTVLQRTEKRIVPRDVKRAIDYMQAKLDSPITVADITAASGIAGRTLFKHFEQFHGISPMQYLRNARFAKVREALARAQPGESITEIAMSWGFSHMGRFSVEYRKRFGERPSESLRRSARRS
jgi:AraC-like DNA-binding protein